MKPAIFEVTYQLGARITEHNRDIWTDPRSRRLVAETGDAREAIEAVAADGRPGRTYEDEGVTYETLGVRIRGVKLVTEFER